MDQIDELTKVSLNGEKGVTEDCLSMISFT